MATFALASSKYQDLISKSVLIQSGSPAVYQLRPKKEKIGTLKRMTLGEKDTNKINKTILLVGETGTGKSTLINALVNSTMGVKWEDNVWFKIVEEEKRSQAESQTTDVIVYQIFGFEGQILPFSLTIIDTPGYGDTRGTEHDDIISQRLFDLFRSEDGVHEINAVGLVMKASLNRLDERLRYIFDSVVSLFGKDMEKNIVALITHSNGMRPENVLQALEDAEIKCAKDEDNEPVHFLFDNCQSTERTKKYKVSLKNAWDLTMDQMSQFKEFLEINEPQKLKTTVEVLNERVKLTACIQNLQERVEFIELKQREIQQTQEALRKYEEEMKKNEDFTVEVEETFKDKMSISGGGWGFLKCFYEGAVTCNVCEENCHYPGCTMARSANSCEVMTDRRCTVCTGRCPVSDHVKQEWIYVTKTRKVQRTLKDMKEKYKNNKAESKNKLSLLENLQRETDKLTAEKDRWLDESFQHVVRLEQIALNDNSLSTYVHLDFLIKKVKEKGDTAKVQKLEEMKHRAEEDKGLRAATWYMRGKLAAAGKALKGRMK